MGLSIIRHGCLRYDSGLRLHPSGAGFVMYGMMFLASAKAPLGVCHFYNLIKLGGHRGVYLIFSQPCDTVRVECDRKRCLNNFKLTDLDKNMLSSEYLIKSLSIAIPWSGGGGGGHVSCWSSLVYGCQDDLLT